MGSSQAVAHAVLLDMMWLQWEPVTLQLCWAPLLGLGFLLPVAASQFMLVPRLGENCFPGPFSESVRIRRIQRDELP